GDTDTYWCAGYNYTGGYIGDLSADWWCSNTSVGTVTASGSSTVFTAVGKGTCYVMATYYLAKIMPAITNVTGTITVIAPNQPPTVNITYPSEDQTVSGTITIVGTANDADSIVQKVEVKIDAGEWHIATGTTSWSFVWDTTTVSNGLHTIYAKAYDGIDYSEVVSLNVYVDNPVPNQPPIASFVYYRGIEAIDGEHVNITLRVAGEKYKFVNMTVYEGDEDDEYDTVVGFVSIERVPGSPDEQSKSVEVQINCYKLYTIILNYSAVKKGGNPVWVIVEYQEISDTEHFVFHEDGESEELNLTETLNIMLWASGLVKFDASSSYDPDGEIVNYTWNFGDNTFGYGIVAYNIYNPGNYTVTLTVKDNNGTTTSASKTIVIQELTGYCAGYKAQFGIALRCPADLTITSPTGAFIGYNASSSEHENWLEGSSMIIAGEREYYFAPGDFNYVYVIRGLAPGDFTFLVFAPGDFAPGDFGPGDFAPGDFTGRTYQLSSSLSSNSLDRIEITSEGNIIKIVSSADKIYNVRVISNTTTYSYPSIELIPNASYGLELDWENRRGNLSIDYERDGIVDAVIKILEGMQASDLLKPDLKPELTISKSTPNEGDLVKITIRVENVGTRGAVNILVHLYIGDELIIYTSPGLSSRGERGWYAEFTKLWVAKPGKYNIRVVVDPEKRISELDETNNEASGVISVEGKKPSAITPATIVTIGGVAGITTLILFALVGTELGKYKFLTLLAPLFMKVRKEELLDNFLRGQIYGYIKANPGAHYTLIKSELDIKNGTLAYHLNLLERQELIKSKMDATRRRFYPAEMKTNEEITYLNKTQEAIINAIREKPGVSQKEIAKVIGVSPQVVNYYIQQLEEGGVIRVVQEGKHTRCFFTE
ncbi:MAG: winged helix-turn-helix transcriptional regulator, partial [Candidatus Thermoplasmatota archaeon]